MLATKCIELLSKPGRLKQDICGIDMPGVRRADVANYITKVAIPAEVAYACRYWVYHIEKCGQRLCDLHHVYTFLKKHFLNWTEALCWLGEASSSINQVSTLSTLTEVSVLLTINK